jgi:hypothetical protein
MNNPAIPRGLDRARSFRRFLSAREKGGEIFFREKPA